MANFPASPNPADVPRVAGSTRGNVYYTGETPTFTWTALAFAGTY